LISSKILNSFIKLKCQVISCGFEHCVALMTWSSEKLNSDGGRRLSELAGKEDEDEGKRSLTRSLQRGFVYSWGLGDSGCLGHGDYNTLEEPRMLACLGENMEEGSPLQANVVYVEAGGYHNGVITADSQVLLWGRGDVGQLGLSKDVLSEDQKGHVALTPALLEFPDKRVDQIALGEVHTLFLTHSDAESGEPRQHLYSCGWNDLGQLGMSAQQEEDEKDRPLHHIELHFEDQEDSIKQIKCGAVFSTLLTAKGHVYAWGNNANG